MAVPILNGVDSVNTADIAANAVTLAKLANSPSSRILGRVTAGLGNVEALTTTQATTLVDVFTSGLKGAVPASGGGTTNFLRADGTFAAPPSGGTPPTGTGFRHITAGAEDAAAKLVDTADISANAVTFEKFQTASVLGGFVGAAGSGDYAHVTYATTRTRLNVADGATANKPDPQRFMLAADLVRSGAGSAVLATITDGTTPWSFSLTAGKLYRVTVQGGHKTVAATTGIQLFVNSSGGLAGNIVGDVYASVVRGNAISRQIATLDTFAGAGGAGITSSAVNPINLQHANGMNFVFECTTSGTMVIQFASEAANSAATLVRASTLLVQEI